MGRWRNWQTPVLEPSVQYGAGALHADVAKLADALGLGPSARKGMSVRLRPSAFEGSAPEAHPPWAEIPLPRWQAGLTGTIALRVQTQYNFST